MRARAGLAMALILTLLTAGSLANAGPQIQPFGPAEPNRLYVLLTPYSVAGPTAIATFEIGSDGEPRWLSTLEIDGLGRARTSPQTVLIHPLRALLLAAHNRSNEVSVLRIAADGSLTPVAGSPFSVRRDAVFMSLDPFRDQLYVTEAGSVGVYEITAEGQLVERQFIDNFRLGETAPHPSGRYLYAADFLNGVRGYASSGSGDWTEMTDSPFRFPDISRTQQLKIDSVGERLYVLDLDSGVAVFDIEPSGSLSLVAGSPFSAGGFASPFQLTADDRFVYVSRSFPTELVGFATTPQGPLEAVPGSPFRGDFVAAILLNPFGTTRLYEITRETRRIWVHDIDPAGALAPTAYSPIDVLDPADRVPAGAAFWVVRDDVVRP